MNNSLNRRSNLFNQFLSTIVLVLTLSILLSPYGSIIQVRAETVEKAIRRTNLALNKKATQSSTANGGDASRAVDGNTDGNWSKNSVTHTNLEYRPWLQIDLGAVYDIGEIKIYNRTDSLQVQQRLDSFWVMYSDSEIINNGNTVNGTGVKPFGSTGPLGASSQNPRILRQNAKNVRYIRIYLTGTDILNLAEVEVFGTASAQPANVQVTNVALGKSATQSSTTFGAEAGRAVDGNTDGSWYSKSVTHTSLKGGDPWWEVDLGAPHDITEIKIFKRTDCCTSTLNNFRIVYSDQPINARSPEYIGFQPGSNTSEQSFKNNRKNVRYIRITVKGKIPLYLAEVQVLGAPSNAPSNATSSTGTAPVKKIPVEKCSEGYISAADGECVLRIWFLPKPSVTLAQANSLAKANDWVLATPAQLKYAWEKGVVDAYAFGMLRDGSFAVPVQKDYKDFKRGVNLNANGQPAEGFFVALEAAVKPLETAARSATNPPLYFVNNRPDLKPVPYFAVVPDSELFKPLYCQKGLKNLMLDGWDNSTMRPLLEESGKLWLAKKKIAYNPSSLKTLETTLKNRAAANNVTRWEFAPFMLRVAWQALVAPRPTPAQLAFRKGFEEYAPCDENKLNRITLSLWNIHLGRGNDVTTGTQWIGSAPPYKANTLAITLDTGITTEGFLPLDNPLFLGLKGHDAVNLLYKPMMANNTPEYDDRENLRALSDEEMTKTAVGVGLGSAFGGGAVFYTVMGAGFLKSIWTKVGNPAIAYDAAAYNWESTVREIKGPLLREQGKTTVEIEKIIANEMAEWHAEQTAKKLSGEVGEKAGKKAVSSITTKAGEKTFNIIGRKIAARVLASASINVLSGAAFFASVFGEVMAQHIKTIDYDKALRKGAGQVTPLDVQKYLADGSESKKVKLFTQLVKMTIADPADSGLLTMSLPDIPCPYGNKRAEANGWCVGEVKFYPQPGITKNQAHRIASQNGWQLAYSAEVSEAWELLKFNSPAWGLLADNGFAYPVQQKTGQLEPGANLGIRYRNENTFFRLTRVEGKTYVFRDVEGKNQGFYYIKKRVEFHKENNLTLEQARAKALLFGGNLATPEDMEIAWQKQGLDVPAYGRMSDGRFAVPVQKDISRFKRGANIGVTGGNQGFFYVRLGDQTKYLRGQTAMTCESGKVDNAGLCYRPCRPGYTGVAGRCYQSCPAGFQNSGLYCGKPEPYTRPGYRWQPGDPPLPNYAGPRGRCEARWGKGNCQQVAALFYPKCKPGFYNAGSDVCSPQCPPGMTDIGVSCQKPFYERGDGKPTDSCNNPDFPIKQGALCYAACRRGYVGSYQFCKKPENVGIEQ